MSPVRRPMPLAAAALIALAWSATPSGAQTPKPADPAVADSAAPGVPQLIGTWEGTYTTDGPMGNVTMTVRQDPDGWKVESLLTGDAPPPGPVSEVKAAGRTLRFRQVYGEYDVVFKATLGEDGATMSGTIEATQAGTYVGGGSFSLTRKA